MPKAEKSRRPLPISLFDYHLPEELIAQRPLSDRSASRLLVLDRANGEITHTSFRNIEDWLRDGDVLVINDTRVMPARLMARRATGGQVEILLLEALSGDEWHAMVRPARRIRPGEKLTIMDRSGSDTGHSACLLEKLADGTVCLRIPHFAEVLREAGRVPLPGYITEALEDPERYQTVYARETGSVAAPTAGLHFTDDVLERLSEQGVEIARVTLHVGPGTFQPVKVEDASQHRMHAERFAVSQETLNVVRHAKLEGRRIIAVGTTSCRTLEAIADRVHEDGPVEGETELYITPGFEFRLVDGLLTNFHLPKSTLLLLVSALAGREPVLRSYSEAIDLRYRFYSFGDAMLIV